MPKGWSLPARFLSVNRHESAFNPKLGTHTMDFTKMYVTGDVRYSNLYKVLRHGIIQKEKKRYIQEGT